MSLKSEKVRDDLFFHFCKRVLDSGCEVLDQEYFYRIIGNIANWLTGIEYNRSLNLCGTVGIGKSTILRAIMDMMNNSPVAYKKVLVTANNVANIAVISESSWEHITTIPILMIDDVGTEPYEVKEFGNSILPFTQLIEARYNRGLSTIITTNLTIEDINSRYGMRVADRINEFHTIKYNRESYRKG